ncbi:aminotransferase class I/II-fold pyridoxal phosphate-dependent enzyme [Hymenobacter taeanensis]|uniref:Aminotransferase class I/II-fold pyridoxal phosphate-dependent enzyme n=1 Tax=Hymenobacter taeanensis TaxID=2735321 RepID=A0A6M6BLY1_9BACT|nr:MULTISPECIES: aminotransferase class I/II-fold pyridoxal phosphate-dependent enzyme [Hymenobacter]QJX48453.1 aminotransferase class I/II-fold pyridoxal phosphate-dependent enzyme [Hymenobacter taeanensis]UOQ82054.1 aminotransferase class I/II-fold pyridoxal phosphate-dependent enzyme [Hymenobacter sp. 5414T-23]
MQVSRMAGSLIGSEIIKIGNEVNDMIRKGEQICNLTIGDFDPSIFPIPEELQQEITLAYQAGHTNYPPANGMVGLREAAAAFTKSRLGLEYSPNDFLVAGGSRPLIYATYLALVDPGDKVVFPVPSWNNNHYCHLSSAQSVMVETRAENNFMPTAEELAPHLEGATLLALCSPLNPTGTVFTREGLEAICDLVLAENKRRQPGEKPLYLLYDQIYWLLTFGTTEHYDPVNLRPELRDYTIYIDGISKCLAATGVRVGYAFGPLAVIDKMKAILGHVGAWAPKAEQVATAKYLPQAEKVDGFMSQFKDKVQRSLTTLHQGLQALKADGYPVDSMVPMGAIYLTAKLDVLGKTTPAGQVLTTTKELTSYLISEARLALVPFSAFGNEHTAPWFRMSVGGASHESIEAALPRLRAALDALV